MTDFLALVAALMSADNATRKQAEAAYATYKGEHPQELVLQLVQLLRTGQDAEARAFAPVLLRPLVEVKVGVYDKLDAHAQLALKAQLLEAVAVEPVAHIRRKIGHLIAEVASVSLKFGQQWPELLAAVSTLTTHADALMRETAFDLLAKLAEYVGELLAPHKQEFLTLFTNSLNDSSGEVQIASLKAASSFLLTLEAREELAAFAIIINPMLRIIEALLKAGDEATFREVLSVLVQVAELHPKFFRNNLDDVGRAMVFISSTQDLDADTRELAVEFLLSLAENAGGMEGEELVNDDEDDDFSIISDDAVAQLKSALAKLQAQLPAPVVQAAWSALSGEAQQALAQL
uniref:IPO4/5-like TPR repeats domain-containing protein n=1 Tax=Globisporangium ultimum (strain ATCC 200006 / CBS 805.95 / DAOM BR144) TaxID=431595 RepID=K3W6M1_GLOUD